MSLGATSETQLPLNDPSVNIKEESTEFADNPLETNSVVVNEGCDSEL